MLEKLIGRAANRILTPTGYKIERRLPNQAAEKIAHLHKTASVKTVLDVGGYRGETTEKFLRLFSHAKVHTFEPAPESFKVLKLRVQDSERVYLNNVALSDRDGTATLLVSPYNTSTNSIVARNINVERTADDVEIEVQTMKLDTYVKMHELTVVSVLKIDVEGAEKMLLDGAKVTFKSGIVKSILIEVMFLEHYNGQALFYEICGILASYNFYLFDLPYMKRTPSGRLRWGDAIFIHESFVY